MPLPLLEGEVLDDGRDQEIESLREQIRELESELATARAETAKAKRSAALALSAVRRQLAPWHNALKALFGEIDAAGVTDESAAPVNGAASKVWESWKQKLPGSPANMIDALLIHGELSAQALRIHMQCRLQTVYDAAFKLNKAGVIVKNGGKYRLREMR